MCLDISLCTGEPNSGDRGVSNEDSQVKQLSNHCRLETEGQLKEVGMFSGA